MQLSDEMYRRLDAARLNDDLTDFYELVAEHWDQISEDLWRLRDLED